MERVDDVAPTGVEFILWFSSTRIPLLRSCGLIRFDFQRPGGMVRCEVTQGFFFFPSISKWNLWSNRCPTGARMIPATVMNTNPLNNA